MPIPINTIEAIHVKKSMAINLLPSLDDTFTNDPILAFSSDLLCGCSFSIFSVSIKNFTEQIILPVIINKRAIIILFWAGYSIFFGFFGVLILMQRQLLQLIQLKTGQQVSWP